MEKENYIRTLSSYQIEQLKILFLTAKIYQIGREDKTGDLLVQYQKVWVDDYNIDRIKIKRTPLDNDE